MKFLDYELFELLIVVNEFNIKFLISYIQKRLIKHKYESLQQNLIEILETTYQHEPFTHLWNYFLEIICEEPNILFNSVNFTRLKSPLLDFILKLDGLWLDEIIVWDYLLKWGIAQNPLISQDTTKWSKEDFTIMERTIHEFIPLIRFYDI